MSELLAEAVESQLDIPDWLARALRTVPRANFLDESAEDLADEDTALPMDRRHYSVQPSILARMLVLGTPSPGEQILEIGAGSGYLTALLCVGGGTVTAVEQDSQLARHARRNLEALGLQADVLEGDGRRPPRGLGPWDLVVFGGAVASLDACWRDALAPGGRIVVPLGSPWQRLALARPAPDGWHLTRDLAVDFAMLVPGGSR